jgi:tetratricopeptide (TPR) repeat protein
VTAASLGIARVLAHCGGSPAGALAHLGQAIGAAPHDPEPYALVAELRRESPDEVARAVAAPRELWQFVVGSYLCFLDGDMDAAVGRLGSVIGYRPDVAWACAPWFSDPRFLGAVTPLGLSEAGINITDYRPDLTDKAAWERLEPWLRAIDVVCERAPVADAMARMAMLLRDCGRTDAALALCDRADAVEPVMFTEVVRAGTWRRLGDRERTAEAFRGALRRDPTNWSLYLDLADLAAEDGDFAEAASLVARGLAHEPHDVTLRAAGAAFRARSGGSVADLDLLLELAPHVPHAGYRDGLIDHAVGGEGLPAERVDAARRLQAGRAT